MNTLAPEEPSDLQEDWLGSLDLEFQKESNRTKLVKNHHQGPLCVQKPFYPEGLDHPHVYIIHPPGGIVSGDRLDISVLLRSQAQALVTGPGASRFYKARERKSLQRQTVELAVAEKSVLEWFPLETIVFDGAKAELVTSISLRDDSMFIGWEICCLGMPAAGEKFSFGSFFQRYAVTVNNTPEFVDVLDLHDGTRGVLDGKAGMQSMSVSGFMLIGPINGDMEPELETLRGYLVDFDDGVYASMSKVGKFLVGRYLGNSADLAKTIFMRWWDFLRPNILNRRACVPRIWFT